MKTRSNSNLKLGFTAALLSGLVWGLLPIFWKALMPIESSTIILYRIVLVAIFAFIIALKNSNAREILRRLKDWQFIRAPIVAGMLITVNWSLYIWAVNAGKIIETSIGYYIEPLLICVFGVVIFKEKFTIYKGVACLFASIGVAVIVIYYFQLPIIAISLAISFGLYAVMKKKYAISPVLSLFYETIFLAPVALGLIIYLEVTGKGTLMSGAEPYQFILLATAGLITILPLGLYAYAAMKIPLISLGLTGYIPPTIAAILGVLMYGETFTIVELATFGIIWIGLVIFTIGENKAIKEEKRIMDRDHIQPPVSS